MYCQVDMCCLCLNRSSEDLQPLIGNGFLSDVSYYEKINSSLTKLVFNKDYFKDYRICIKCCSTIDSIYEFNNSCIKNLEIMTHYRIMLSLQSKTQSDLVVKLSDVSNALVCNKETLKDATTSEVTDLMVHNTVSKLSDESNTLEQASTSKVTDLMVHNTVSKLSDESNTLSCNKDTFEQASTSKVTDVMVHNTVQASETLDDDYVVIRSDDAYELTGMLVDDVKIECIEDDVKEPVAEEVWVDDMDFKDEMDIKEESDVNFLDAENQPCGATDPITVEGDYNIKIRRIMSLSRISSLSELDDLTDDDKRPIKQRIHRPRRFLDRNDPFDIYNDEDFKQMYRMNKATFMEVLHLICDQLEPPTKRNKSLSAKLQLLVTLRFYATGTFKQLVGDHIQIHKSSISRLVCKVTREIALLKPRYINMPKEEEKNTVKLDFYKIGCFPDVIGTMDCTHIPIQSPGGPRAEQFRNVKGFFSINIQIISDAKLKIRHIIARWPGSVHDSRILNDSPLGAEFEAGKYGSDYLLGDNSYPCKKFVLTPLLYPQTRNEKAYNEAHIATRNVVEKCFEVLKRRFPCLVKGMAIKLERILTTIIACAVLHNICVINEDFGDFEDIVIIEVPEILRLNDDDTSTRDEIIQTVFDD